MIPLPTQWILDGAGGNLFRTIACDTERLSQANKAVYIGSSGDLVMMPVDSASPMTFHNVAACSVLDIRPRAEKSTGLTAADLVGLA